MGRVDDPARLDAVLAALSPGDAEWLSRQLEPPWRTAQRRREARAEVLRAAREVIAPGLRPRPAAEALAAELRRYLAGPWRGHRHLPEMPAGALLRHQVLHQVAVLTGGKALAWRTIWEAYRDL